MIDLGCLNFSLAVCHAARAEAKEPEAMPVEPTKEEAVMSEPNVEDTEKARAVLSAIGIDGTDEMHDVCEAIVAQALATARQSADREGWQRAVGRIAQWFETKADMLGNEDGGAIDSEIRMIVDQHRSDAKFIRTMQYELPVEPPPAKPLPPPVRVMREGEFSTEPTSGKEE